MKILKVYKKTHDGHHFWVWVCDYKRDTKYQNPTGEIVYYECWKGAFKKYNDDTDELDGEYDYVYSNEDGYI